MIHNRRAPVVVTLLAALSTVAVGQAPALGRDVLPNSRIPGSTETWQSRFPQSLADAKERLGVFTGTFRGDKNWKVQLDVYLDTTFAPNQKAALRKAAGYLLEELFAGRVWNCAEQRGPQTRPSPTVGDFQDYLYQQLRVEEKLRGLYITRFWYDDTSIFGLARLGDRGPVGQNWPRSDTYYTRSGNFWITLNSQKIGDDIPGGTISERAWAGIMAHEMQHNLGLVHPTFDSTGIRSDFIYAFGDCM